MKLIYQILLGILVATALSFVIVSFGTVQPVLKQPTAITPVPTPQVVYITVTPTDAPHVDTSQTPPAQQEPLRTFPEGYDDDPFMTIIQIAIVSIGLLTILVTILSLIR